MSIQLRVSEEATEAADIDSVIFLDMANMPSLLYLTQNIRVYNNWGINLYFTVTLAGSGWTFTNPQTVGLINNGADLRKLINNWGYRTKPATEVLGTLTFTLYGYDDAGYSNLVATYTRVSTICIIDSSDGTWTEDYHDDFEDGTAEGWVCGDGGGAIAGQYTTRALETKPTCARFSWASVSLGNITWYMVKTFTTPNANYVFLVFNIFAETPHAGYHGHNMTIIVNGVTKVYLGIPSVWNDYTLRYSINRWYRFTVPLPVNTSVEIKYKFVGVQTSAPIAIINYIDDIKIISK